MTRDRQSEGIARAGHGASGRRPVAAALCGIAFLSGCGALLFETLWFRVAGLAFGNGIWASSIVLASFMGGLAAGNYLAARLAGRLARPIRFYAWLELAIGTMAAGLVLLMPALTSVLALVFAPLREMPWLLNGMRVPIAFALMMVPATAMGATLPVLVKASFAEEPRFGRVLGRLYGWNTLGAVVGALLGEAWLLGWLGLRGSALAAAGIDALAAAAALALARAAEPAERPRPPRQERWRPSRAALRLLAAAFLAGGSFLALEVVWFRFLSLFVYGTSLVFAVMLAVVLVGISLGGLAAARGLRSGASAAPFLPALALLSAVLSLLCYAGFAQVFRVALEPVGGTAAARVPDVVLVSAPLMLPVAFLSGVLFTAIGDAAKREIGEEARTTGLLTLANTVGAALGSLLAGFVLLPQLGIERSLVGLSLAYVAVAVLTWRPAWSVRTPTLAAGGLAAVFAWSLVVFPHGALRSRYLPHPTKPFLDAGSRIVAVREGLVETLVYVRTDRFGRPLHYRLFTDGFSMSATTTHSRRYMKAFVYLPLAVHPDPRRALLVSYGVGSTAKALTDSRSLESIDVVEISPDILEMSSIVFPQPGDDPLNDPRVRVHVEDARFFLQTSRQRFDLITGEPPPPKYAGVVNLYTREYFQLIRERLAEGGITTYWLPVHNLGESDAKAIIAAFCGVFADCSLWTGAGLDWILVGTRGASRPVSEAWFRRQWEDPAVAPELAALGFERPEQLGATFLAGPERLGSLTRGAPPLVDDFPQRLSDEPVLPSDAHRMVFFRSLMDVAGAEADFRRSPLVERLWPAPLRRATLPYFRWQRVVNGRLLYDGESTVSERDLYAVLRETSLETLPLWILGGDVEQRRIVEGLPPRRARRPDVQRLRGIGALAGRDYREAALRFRRARAVSARTARLMHLEVFALCMAGELEQAAALARELVRASGGAAGSDEHWRWMEATFGLPDPRSS